MPSNAAVDALRAALLAWCDLAERDPASAHEYWVGVVEPAASRCAPAKEEVAK